MSSRNYFNRFKKECQQYAGTKNIIIPANDPKNCTNGRPEVLFVLERPGPKATKRVSWDNQDSTASAFKLLFEIVFKMRYRRRIFITNAILWRPKQRLARNVPPISGQVQRESGILKAQIEDLKPRFIVPLGGVALNALRCIYNEPKLGRSGLIPFINRKIRVNRFTIHPLAHPAPLGQGSRGIYRQREDWEKLRKLIGW